MNLFESIKKKINKSRNGENVSHLEITEVVLVHFKIVMIINSIQKSCIHLFRTNN